MLHVGNRPPLIITSFRSTFLSTFLPVVKGRVALAPVCQTADQESKELGMPNRKLCADVVASKHIMFLCAPQTKG